MTGFLYWLLSSLWGVGWGLSFFGTIDLAARGACFFVGCILFVLVAAETALTIGHGEGEVLVLPAVAAVLTMVVGLPVLHWAGLLSLPVGVFIGFGVLLALIAIVAVGSVANSVSSERKRILGNRRW